MKRLLPLQIIIWAILSAIIVAGCANETAPTGGKRDDTPPKIRKATPENFTTNFTSKEIKLTFDEYIRSEGFAKVLISPPIDPALKFKMSGKTLTIKLPENLRPNTTYTINFGDDIKDVNEANVLTNFTYVFSTGNFIDSLKIRGKVIDVAKAEEAEGFTVSLYQEDTADGILSSKPFYFAKTDKGGNFEIRNIKEGKYHIYTLKDQNFNYIFDQPNELIGFSDSLISITDTIVKEIALTAFQQFPKKLFVSEKKSIEPGHLQFVFSRPVNSFILTSSFSSDSNLTYQGIKNDTITYWFTKPYIKRDTMYLQVNDTLLDTLRMDFKFIEYDSLYVPNKYPLSIVNKTVTRESISVAEAKARGEDLFKPLILKLSRPIAEIDKNKALSIFEDSVRNPVKSSFELDGTNKQDIKVKFQKKEKTMYTVEIPDSMFRDIFGIWNRKIVYAFTSTAKDSYGNILLNISGASESKSYLVQLLNAQDVVVEEIRLKGVATKKEKVENLLSGVYKIKVIEDANGNGRWDTGDFYKKKQPEKIIINPNAYTLKGGWDLDVEVKL
jgi:hypothetical protein